MLMSLTLTLVFSVIVMTSMQNKLCRSHRGKRMMIGATAGYQGRRMKIGILLDGSQEADKRFCDIKAMAQTAEQIGADSFWLPDHLIFRHSGQEERGVWEALSMLSALAAVTTRIRLGPLVACTSFRNPALLAKMVDTLDEISNGRLILGLGAGWHKPEYDAFGYPFNHLASRFEEALQIIVPLLREGKVDFKGRYYEAREALLRPRGASQYGPPIWIGSAKPRMLELTARYADAWNTVWHRWPESVLKIYPMFVEACRRVGRDPADIELTAGTMAHVLGPGETGAYDVQGISGSPEEVAQALHGFAEIGVKHLVVVIEPGNAYGVDRFALVLELLDQIERR